MHQTLQYLIIFLQSSIPPKKKRPSLYFFFYFYQTYISYNHNKNEKSASSTSKKEKKDQILIRHTLQPNVTDQSWAGLDDSRKKRIFHTFLPTTIFSPNLLTSPPKGRCACTGVGEDFSPPPPLGCVATTQEAIFDLPGK